MESCSNICFTVCRFADLDLYIKFYRYFQEILKNVCISVYRQVCMHVWCAYFSNQSCFPFRLESSLLEVLQMDFEVEELSSPVDSQVIIWKLELPSASQNVAKTEGAMRIYTTQRDFVGLAPLVMVSWLTASTSHLITIITRFDVTDSSVSNNANTWTASLDCWCMKIS